jgi:Peptidase A4 family
VNKLYRFTGTAAAAVTIAASAAAFSAPYAAARTTAHQSTSAASAASAAPAPASPAPQPMIPAPQPGGPAGTSATTMIDTTFSHNWGGYAVHQSGVKFRAIKATFFVPFINCAVTPGNTSPGNFSSHWVGLDGFASNTVEQDGIEADCSSGSAHYDAWHEVFPRPEQPVKMKIRPGDSITASVRYSKSTRKYRLEVMDNTNGNHFTVHQRCAGSACVRASAEAISEAPSDSSGILPMADYGASSFAAISITGGSGQTGGIKSSHWSHSKIIQVGFHSDRTIASPTALHGRSFDVYWLGQN